MLPPFNKMRTLEELSRSNSTVDYAAEGAITEKIVSAQKSSRFVLEEPTVVESRGNVNW
jgi:hypothetical protein